MFKCGVCVCDDNFSGEFCQCSGSEKGNAHIAFTVSIIVLTENDILR